MNPHSVRTAKRWISLPQNEQPSPHQFSRFFRDDLCDQAAIGFVEGQRQAQVAGGGKCGKRFGQHRYVGNIAPAVIAAGKGDGFFRAEPFHLDAALEAIGDELGDVGLCNAQRVKLKG